MALNPQLTKLAEETADERERFLDKAEQFGQLLNLKEINAEDQALIDAQLVKLDAGDANERRVAKRFRRIMRDNAAAMLLLEPRR